MATLQVQSNGNAPSNAKVGDHIITAGGTYEVLDGSQYQGKSAEELASAGVGYNPSSGLYSKKISDVTNFTGKAQSTIPQLSLRTSDTARQWANTQNQKVSSDLDSAYYQNRQDAYNSYMDAITRQNQQANDVNQAYLDNISKLYNDTYQNNNAVLERMASRGLTSSGLGNAMQVSALANASKQNADYRAQRNRDLNNIETEMNNLTNQYNVNLDTLAKKLRSDKISALSQNEIAFLEQVMAIEEYNANAENQALTTQQQQAYEAEQALLNREFQAYQTAVNNQHEMDMLLKQIEAGSFSGGGGYGYGGYGGYRRRGWGGYSRYGYGGSSPAVASDDPASGMGLTGAKANAYNYADALSKITPGGFLEPDKQLINGLALAGASASEMRAAADAARLNSIAVSNGYWRNSGSSSSSSSTTTKKTSTNSRSNTGTSKKQNTQTNQQKTQSGRSTGLKKNNNNKKKNNNNKKKKTVDTTKLHI